MKASLISFALASTLALGCSAAGPDGTPISGEGDATITRTIVRLNADGTETVHQVQITEAQQRADVAAREAATTPGATTPHAGEKVGTTSEAITTDDGCGGASMWLFDGTNLTGNEICFIGAGTANLKSYIRQVFYAPRLPTHWNLAVRSYYAGNEAGDFRNSGAEFTYSFFNAYARANTVDWNTSHADTLDLN